MYGTSRFEKRVFSAIFDVLIGVVLEIQGWWDINHVRRKPKALRLFKKVQ
jgi:hypothetical protein